MGKTIVWYGSCYGSTARYAQEIAKRLGCEAADVRHCQGAQLSAYDTVVFGGGLYAGSIRGVKALTRCEAQLADKRLIVFTVGMMPADAEQIAKVRTRNFSPALQAQTQFFHLTGVLDYGRMKLIHRVMMAGLRAMMRKQKEQNAFTRFILETYGKRTDLMDLVAIEPIVQAAQKA